MNSRVLLLQLSFLTPQLVSFLQSNTILQFILRNSVYLHMSNDVYVCACVSASL